eukprot:m.97461 g.97461  ORF g.97461 m.97461 type:complete len:554 (+) comp13979_c0_seq1:199-1860(+)
MNRFLWRIARVCCLLLLAIIALLLHVRSQGGTINLCKPRVVYSTGLDLDGWWMPHYAWRSSCVHTLDEFDVDLFAVNQSHVSTGSACHPGQHHVLSAICRRDSVRATYQYLPIDENAVDEQAEFSALVLVSELQEIGGVPKGAQLSSIVHVVDDAYDRNQGQSQPLSSPSVTLNATLASSNTWESLSASVSMSHAKRSRPGKHRVTGIVIMLVCGGFDGVVHFADISLRGSSRLPASRSSLCRARKKVNPTPLVTDMILEPMPETESQVSRFPFAVVTHASADRLDTLERLAATWHGPLSLVVFLPCCTDRAVLRAYARKRLREVVQGSSMRLWTVTLAYEQDATEQQAYPINALRNLAAAHSPLPYVLHIDADFAPGPASEDMLNLLWPHLQPHTALVVPAFEIDASAAMPKSKEELLAMVAAGDASPFRVKQSPLMHAATNYTHWGLATQPYSITFQDKYEPYYIVHRDGPVFEESFRGYGSNKAAHALELFAAGFTFTVAPSWWLVHRAHAPSRAATGFVHNAHARLATRIQRFELVVELLRKYHLHQCA